MTVQHHSKIRRSYPASSTALSALLVGGLSFVSLGIGEWAIANPTTDSTGHVPSASDLLDPVIKAQPLPPTPTSVTAPSDTDPLPGSPSVNTIGGPTIEFSPTPSVPSTPPSLAPATPSVDLSNVRGDIPVVDIDYGNSYLDTTDYNLGATPGPGMGPAIVFSERSTGCKTVLQQGQSISSGFCGSVANANTIAGMQLPLGNGDASGGQGSGLLPQINSVAIGPLSIGPNGVSITRGLSVQAYYNRTQRPKALAGNHNSTLLFPLSIPAMISSPFGMRVHPLFGSVRMHTGTDLSAPMGTPVVAAYSGRVAVADFMGGYGLTVVIGHSDKASETLYGHLSEVFVKAGDWVEQGHVIGRVGSTGNSTGPHLHFELRQQTANGWVAVNAGSFLQQGLANVHAGFQLGENFSIADASLINPLTGEVEKLTIPKILQLGKYATKEDLNGSLASATDLPSSELSQPQSQPIPDPPGSWISPKELLGNGKQED